MSSGEFFEYDGQKFDLSSQRWRKRRCGFKHAVVLIDETDILFTCFRVEECAFCQANITFDRNLEEILYHLQISKGDHYSRTFSTLIENWKNGKDAWNNPIGENIKGE